MSRRSSILSVALATLLATLAPLAVAAPAQALPPTVSIEGIAAAPTTAPSTETVTYTITVTGGPVQAAVLHAIEPTTLPADPATVQVDGAAAPAGTADQAGAGLTIRLGAGASGNEGGELAAGTHTVAFDVSITSLPKPSTTITATLDYTADRTPATAAATPIPVGLPDLALALVPGLDEDKPLPLSSANEGIFIVTLTNKGAAARAATLTLTLPPGLAIDPSFGVHRLDGDLTSATAKDSRLRCSAEQGNVVTCALGALAAGAQAYLGVGLVATGDGPIGQVGTFTLTALADTGLDAQPTDNTVAGSVRFVGLSHLVVTLTPPTSRVQVGKLARVTARVRNAGAYESPNALGFLVELGSHFRIEHFSGRTFPLPGGGSGGGVVIVGSRPPARQPAVTALLRSAPNPHFVLWNVGTVPAGGTVSAVVTLKARSVGRGKLLAFAASISDGPETCIGPRCPNNDTATLVAYRAAPVPVQPQTHSAQPIANTGPSHAAGLTGAGLLAVLVGALLVLLGSTRTCVGRHRRGHGIVPPY